VLLEAVGFAFLAAINPSALLIGAAYLGSDNPRKTAVFYLAGAVIMTAALGVVFLVAIRAGGLSQVGNRTPRYGLRLGLGVVALAAAIVVARREPKAAPGPTDGDGQKKQGWMARLISRPSPLTAILVGILLFYPSAGLVAAVQAIGTSRDSLGLEAVGVALVVLIDVLTIWVPLLVYLIAPDATTRALRAFDDWLRAHKRTITIVGLTAVGLILIVNGSLGLTGLAVVRVPDRLEDRRFAAEQRRLADLLLDRRGRHRVAEEQQQGHRLDDDRRPHGVESDLAPVVEAVQDGRH
jgi:hypothetical protein